MVNQMAGDVGGVWSVGTSKQLYQMYNEGAVHWPVTNLGARFLILHPSFLSTGSPHLGQTHKPWSPSGSHIMPIHSVPSINN